MEKSGFAAAVGSNQAQSIAGVKPEIEVVQDNFTAGVAELDML